MLTHDKCAAFEAEIEKLKKELNKERETVKKLAGCLEIVYQLTSDQWSSRYAKESLIKFVGKR